MRVVSVTRRSLVLLLAIFLSLVLSLFINNTVKADSTICSGADYNVCISAGKTAHGYELNYMNRYWGAYAGHNCTNYVAYVETVVNRATSPGTDMGHAYQWADSAKRKGIPVDRVPAKGAVAQWNISTNNPDGHVAYVESVGSNGEITISQDAWSAGPFSWKKISPGSSIWPNNFIHFKDLPNTNTTTSVEARIPQVADFTGDGFQDLFTSSKRGDTAPNLSVFASTQGWLDGQKVWGAPGQIKWATAKLVPADIDGDRKTDLLAIQPNPNGVNPDIYWLRSLGSSFAAPQLVGTPNLGFNDVKSWVGGDFNGDGKGDVLAVSKRGDAAPNLVVFSSTGGWLGGATLWSAPGQINWSKAIIVPTDVNGDRKTDLLGIQPNANGINPDIFWIRSLGSSFASPQLVGTPNLVFNDVKSWVSGNFSGDTTQYQDLLAVSKRGDPAANFIVFPSTGGWMDGSALWAAPDFLNFSKIMTVPADINSDSKTDLLVIQPDGNNMPYIYWLKSEGSSFGWPQLVGVPGITFTDTNWHR